MGTPWLSPAAAASLPASVLASASAPNSRTTLSSGDSDAVTDAQRRITHYLPPDLVPDGWRGESFRLYPWQVDTPGTADVKRHYLGSLFTMPGTCSETAPYH